jgi:general secretion pathway protein J
MKRPVKRTSCRGFTLFELLVAMAIFAFIGIMAYGGLAAMIKSSEGSREAREQLASMQRALRVLDDDFSLVVNRSVRDGLGSPHLALMTGRDGSTLLEFTRTARVREGFALSPFSRVRYRLEGGALLRDEWNPPDAAQLEPDQVMTLWSNVAQVRFTFLANGQESVTWPPANAENMSLPQAISVQLVLNDGREITQVMLLPDAGLGDAMSAPAGGAAAAPATDGSDKSKTTTDVEQDRS